MPDIFVSYRRADSPGSAGRLFDRLGQHFGGSQVFRDVDSLEAGEDFDLLIRGALQGVGAALFVIGPRWLDARSKDGVRRLDDPADYVRREIEIALASDVTVIPVLVEGASMPSPEALPEPVRALALRQAFELFDRHWESDIRELLSLLEARVGIERSLAAATEAGSPTARSPSSGAVLVESVSGFVSDLFFLLSNPRRFLARRAQGRSRDVLAAATFFMLAVLVAEAVMTMNYTPRGSMAKLIFAGLVVAVLLTAGTSVPLWLGWRLAGAERLYPRLIVVLLHQVAVMHLAFVAVATLIITGVSLRKPRLLEMAMDEMQKPGGSAAAVLEHIEQEVGPAFDSREALFAVGLSGLVVLAAAIWLFRSWGAYRDAFGTSRLRSFGAFVVSVLAGWAVVRVIAWCVGLGQ